MASSRTSIPMAIGSNGGFAGTHANPEPIDSILPRSAMLAVMEDTVRVRCPYCREWVELYVDPDTTGTLVEDCSVCCRPWTVTVERDADELRVHVSRAQ
jgi:hypothetical protein